MKDPNQWSASTEHEEVYHAAHGCQAASLPLTVVRLRGQKQACPVESEKTKGFFAAPKMLSFFQWMSSCSSSSTSVLLLGGFKGRRLIRLRLLPHGMDHTDPHIGEGPHGHAMTFPFLALALIVLQGPRLRLGRLPGKLVQRVAQRFYTRVAPMNSGVGSALEDHRRRASQRLQFRSIGVALPIIPNFCQQPSRPFTKKSELACCKEVVFLIECYQCD